MKARIIKLHGKMKNARSFFFLGNKNMKKTHSNFLTFLCQHDE